MHKNHLFLTIIILVTFPKDLYPDLVCDCSNQSARCWVLVPPRGPPHNYLHQPVTGTTCVWSYLLSKELPSFCLQNFIAIGNLVINCRNQLPKSRAMSPTVGLGFVEFYIVFFFFSLQIVGFLLPLQTQCPIFSGGSLSWQCSQTLMPKKRPP